MKKEIREFRQSLVLTQGEFAKLIGVAEITVSGWEAGKFLPSTLAQRTLIGLITEVELGRFERPNISGDWMGTIAHSKDKTKKLNLCLIQRGENFLGTFSFGMGLSGVICGTVFGKKIQGELFSESDGESAGTVKARVTQDGEWINGNGAVQGRKFTFQLKKIEALPEDFWRDAVEGRQNGEADVEGTKMEKVSVEDAG